MQAVCSDTEQITGHNHSQGDVSGAYQGLYTNLQGVPRASAKLAAEGVAYYRTKVEGLPAPSGDDRYSLFGETDLHPFFRWIGELITIKTPGLRRLNIVAAMFGTFCKNESEARKFWAEVARGGVEYEDNHPDGARKPGPRGSPAVRAGSAPG